MSNGYIQVDFNGQLIGIKFGYPAVKEFMLAAAEKEGVYYENNIITSLGIAKLIQAGYKNNCLLKEVKPVYTFEQFVDWVEEAEDIKERTAVLTEVVKVWAESRYMKKMIAATTESEDNGAKKKSVKSTSKK